MLVCIEASGTQRKKGQWFHTSGECLDPEMTGSLHIRHYSFRDTLLWTYTFGAVIWGMYAHVCACSDDAMQKILTHFDIARQGGKAWLQVRVPPGWPRAESIPSSKVIAQTCCARQKSI